jgi:hypothetical protein
VFSVEQSAREPILANGANLSSKIATMSAKEDAALSYLKVELVLWGALAGLILYVIVAHIVG